MTDNFEKDINVPSKRPPYEIALMHDHILRLEEELKAKEQECEELKIYIESNEQQVKEVETLVMDNDRLINELDRLKAENEQLKNNDVFSIRYFKDKYDVLKQTLVEIKEIAEIAVNFCKGCGGEDYECIDCTNGGRAQISEEILQKISEVEDEN